MAPTKLFTGLTRKCVRLLLLGVLAHMDVDTIALLEDTALTADVLHTVFLSWKKGWETSHDWQGLWTRHHFTVSSMTYSTLEKRKGQDTVLPNSFRLLCDP